jgi:DNA primase
LEQVRLLLRYSESKQLVLNFDGDKAGINATERAIGEISNLAYKGEVRLKILHIPDGKDADEYLKNHSVTDYEQLLVDAPLWLDWQIAQVIQGRDLKQPTDFQLVSREFVKLLQKILNSDTLNYYISHCAEILSLGDTRLIPLRVENLITQVSPRHSTTSPKTHQISHPQPSLLEQAEGLLLRIFLHCPQERQVIIETLESSNLEFSVSHHRFLWEKSLQFPSQTLDLISLLQNLYLETQNDLGPVEHIFQLNEKNKQEILLRTNQLVQAAIACMEKVFRENRYRHFLELWQKTDPSTDPDQYNLYAQTIYADKMRIQELSKQRQLSISDLIN